MVSGLGSGVRLGEGLVPTRRESARTNGAPEAFMLSMTVAFGSASDGLGLVLFFVSSASGARSPSSGSVMKSSMVGWSAAGRLRLASWRP